MANRLADLNRSRRNYAYSGQANMGDVPWLYAMQAEQAAANRPAGIGDGGGMGGDDMAAPNPQSFGGGTTGAADTGLHGAGQTGFGQEGDEFYRRIVAAREGGQAGEPGGAGAGSVEYGEWGEYVDPTLAELVGYLGPGPVGLVGSLGAMGMRGYNANILDDRLGKVGLPGLSGWQQLGAAFGLNDYGVGTLGQELDTFEGQLRSAGRMPSQNATGAAEGSGYDLGSGFSPGAIAARAQQRVGALGFFGGGGPTAAAGGAGAGAGSSRSARSSYSNTAPGRRGARDSGGGAESGGGRGGGGGGFGCFVGDTPILMADGSRKAIKRIQAGDMVMSFDGLGPLEPRAVAAVMKYSGRKTLAIYYGDGTGIVCTSEHPFLTPGGSYVRAGDLLAGGEVVDASGRPVTIISINPNATMQNHRGVVADVYNFEVEDLHTYVAKGLRVHNIKHDGGVISEDRVPGQARGDVLEILQEGEGVITADAVDVLGPGFIHGINMMAHMMRGRR